MDELLSLFGVGDGSQGADRTDGQKRSGDEQEVHQSKAASSFGEAFGAPSAAKRSSAHAPNGPSSNPHKAAAATKSNNDRTPCDPITGLRIVDRRTSRADMVDAFASYTYRSCSALAAASRAEWTANYLVDGGSGGNGQPAGKTKLATSGILTGDSSSRLSKAGRAFAILTLGDLPSSMQSKGSAFSKTTTVHASIKVFLFGDALGVLRNKKYMGTGFAWRCWGRI